MGETENRGRKSWTIGRRRRGGKSERKGEKRKAKRFMKKRNRVDGEEMGLGKMDEEEAEGEDGIRVKGEKGWMKRKREMEKERKDGERRGNKRGRNDY